MPEQLTQMESRIHTTTMKDVLRLPSYPIDMTPFLILPHCTFDTGVPYQVNPAGYDPTTIAQYALAHWNNYLATNDEQHRSVFLLQVQWLVEHEVRIDEDAGGWPISFPYPGIHTTGSWLSALAQGCVLSVLVRAYRLTQEKVFLEVAHRAVSIFARDILDGGVSTPIGENGVFFEEVAVYPAMHTLSGFVFALFGLYDYVALTNSVSIEGLILRSLATLHVLLNEFDVGFWTYSNLLERELTSRSDLALQTQLLEALALHSSCEYCSQVAVRWRSYPQRLGTRLHYFISSRGGYFGRALWRPIQRALFPRVSILAGADKSAVGTRELKDAPLMPLPFTRKDGDPFRKLPRSQVSGPLRVCIPLPAFAVTGGIQTVLEGVAQVTEGLWEREYLTQDIGLLNPGNYVVHRFGSAKMAPWLFPGVWLYFIAGLHKLMKLLHHGTGYDVILPQDAVFTAAFSALVAKLAGVRVVCIDHGDLTTLRSKAYHAERMQNLARKNWPRALRFLMQRLLVFYWPSLYLLARISARFVDHFLIPGVAGDGVEEVCKELGIPSSRITRYGSMIDVDRHVVYDAASRADIRARKEIAPNAIVVAIVCRLAPEKSLDIALESISQTLSALSPDIRARVRVIIAGDGPLRKQVEEDIRVSTLDQVCKLWGDVSADEIIELLGISDIFLYTSLRGACFSMAILEAMASGCAVVASTRPISNACLLDEGRGIAVSPGSVEETSHALVRLLNDLELCRRMGTLARQYITRHHNPAAFRRTLLRATYWSALDDMLGSETKTESLSVEV